MGLAQVVGGGQKFDALRGWGSLQQAIVLARWSILILILILILTALEVAAASGTTAAGLLLLLVVKVQGTRLFVGCADVTAVTRQQAVAPEHILLGLHELHQFAVILLLFLCQLGVVGAKEPPQQTQQYQERNAIDEHGASRATATCTFWRFDFFDISFLQDRIF